MQITKTVRRACALFVFMLVVPMVISAQSNEVFTLTAKSLRDSEAIELDKAGWKYHAGDDATWANPQFADSSWETLPNSALTIDNLPQTLWRGLGGSDYSCV